MSQCTWIRRLCLWMLPALVLSVAASSSGSINPPGVVDTTTKGTWKTVYGSDGYILAAFTGPVGVGGTDSSSLPSYISSYSVSGLSRYHWTTDSSDPYDLQQPSGSLRNIGCWYTADSGTITLVPSQSRTFQLSVYLRDQDSNDRWDDLSFSGAELTGTDSMPCTAGKWITYTVTATSGTNVVINLQHQAGMNGIINALLFDPLVSDDTTAPDAVGNLATSSATFSSITLTWTAPGDDGSAGTATRYDIRYRTDGTVNEGNWASATPVTGEPTPAAAGTIQSMVVSGLSPSTTYYFALKTRDEAANPSAISNSPSGQTLPPDITAPGAVSNLATGTATPYTMTLTWTAPGNDGATGTATTYDIRYSTAAINEGSWASAMQVTGEPTPATAGTSQSMVVGGLSPGTIYYFAIKTSDEAANTSTISNSPSGTTAALPPTGVLALKRNPGLVAGGGIDSRFAGAAVVTTTVQDALMYGTQQSRWCNGGRAGVSSGYNLNDHLSHKYDLVSVPAYARINLAQLRLYAAGGSGSCGLAMVLTHDWIEGTKGSDYPGAAGGITYWAPIGYNTNFDQNPSGSGSQPWGGWGPHSDSAFDMAVDGGALVNPSSSAQGYIVFDVTAHVQTWVRGGRPNFGWVQNDGRVVSLSESGSDRQPVLFIDYALEGDTTPPATVANLAPSNVTTDSVTLSWTAPGDDGNSGTATSYEIRYAKSPITAASWALAAPATGVPMPQAAGTVQSLVVCGLVSDATYYFAIKAADEVPNTTPLSNVVSVRTLPDLVPPAAVSTLATGNPTNHSLTLTWTAPGDDNTSGTASSYDIRYATSPITAGNWASATPVTGEPAPTVAGTSQSLVIDNLVQNTTYYFAIKTSDEVPLTSSLSNVASGQTLPDIIAPGAVTSLTITKAKSSALRLAWIASGDDGADRTATSYDVRYRTGGAVTEANWASATQVTGEPAAVQPGYHRNMWIYGLSAGTTYYIGVKALDEVGNASTIATASATTPAASLLTRPLLQPEDFEYLGAFKMPRFACDLTTAYARSGMALRRVNGNLQILTCTHVYTNALYECNFPGWGADASTWPQAQIIREWGTAVYGNPTCLTDANDWVAGLNYDQATSRLYYSYASGYNVAQEARPTIGCALLNQAGPVVSGPWLSSNVAGQVMRGGSLTIPDWFADTYLAGRKLGVGFGGGYSGWGSCSPGPTLAAAHHPDGSATYLDTIPLLQYFHDDISKWCTRDADYWSDGVYDLHNPVGDVGYWISMDTVGGAGIWIDLPDKQGLLYLTGMGHGRTWYDYGMECVERKEAWWWVYDPADLAEVAQGNMERWGPQHDSWQMPHNGSGCAFDAQTRTLFVITPQSYTMGGQEAYPLVHGYRIKPSQIGPIWKIGDINKDGYVNVGDLQALVAAWGSQAGPPASSNWNADADINTDAFVNVGDLQLLVAHWGE